MPVKSTQRGSRRGMRHSPVNADQSPDRDRCRPGVRPTSMARPASGPCSLATGRLIWHRTLIRNRQWLPSPLSAVYSCTGALGPAVRICRISRVCEGQLGWRLVMAAAGGPVRARAQARRRASGSGYRPAMRQTRSAASAAGIPGCGDEQRAGRGSAQDRHGAWRCGTGTWPPRSPGCRTRRADAPQGRVGRRDPGRRSRR